MWKPLISTQRAIGTHRGASSGYFGLRPVFLDRSDHLGPEIWPGQKSGRPGLMVPRMGFFDRLPGKRPGGRAGGSIAAMAHVEHMVDLGSSGIASFQQETRA
jgi:hypothetical protein